MRHPAPQSLRELVVRAEALAGHTLGELAAALDVALPADPRSAKGLCGSLVELALGAAADAGDGPDFPDLGVELKTIPIGANGRPAESTFVCSIAMAHADREEWHTSRLRRRLACVLWVPVTAARLAPLPSRRLGRASLWRPSAQEESVLKADWEDLMGALGAGRADELTAHRGSVLQVRPKARSATVRTVGLTADGAGEVAPRGFYLRASFTAEVLAASG